MNRRFKSDPEPGIEAIVFIDAIVFPDTIVFADAVEPDI